MRFACSPLGGFFTPAARYGYRAFFTHIRKQIMAKIKLGNRPKNFKRKVEFDMLDGTQGVIESVFKYRTRSEFGAFVDEIFDNSKQDKSETPKQLSMAELMEKTKETNADYLLKVLDGWDIESELNRDSLQQLADEVPAAVGALMEAYRVAILEGRLGN